MPVASNPACWTAAWRFRGARATAAFPITLLMPRVLFDMCGRSPLLAHYLKLNHLDPACASFVPPYLTTPLQPAGGAAAHLIPHSDVQMLPTAGKTTYREVIEHFAATSERLKQELDVRRFLHANSTSSAAQTEISQARRMVAHIPTACALRHAHAKFMSCQGGDRPAAPTHHLDAAWRLHRIAPATHRPRGALPAISVPCGHHLAGAPRVCHGRAVRRRTKAVARLAFLFSTRCCCRECQRPAHAPHSTQFSVLVRCWLLALHTRASSLSSDFARPPLAARNSHPLASSALPAAGAPP